MSNQNKMVNDLARVFKEFGNRYYQVHYKPTEDKRIQQETIKTLENFENNPEGLNDYLIKKNKLLEKQQKLNSENIELNRQNQDLKNTLNTSNNELVKKNLELTQKIEQQSTQISQLQENQRLTRNNAPVINRLNPIQPTPIPISNPTQIISYNSEESERLKEKIKELENQISELKRQPRTSDDAIEIQNLKSQLEELKMLQVNCIKEEEKTKLEQEKNNLQQEKNNLQQEKTKLEQEKNKLEQEKTNLQGERTNLQQKNNELIENLRSVENILANNIQQNNTNVKLEQLEQLQNENKRLKENNKDLKSNNDNLQLAKLNIGVEKNQLEQEKTNLQDNLIELAKLNDKSFKKLDKTSKEIKQISEIMEKEQLIDKSEENINLLIDTLKLAIKAQLTNTEGFNENELALAIYMYKNKYNEDKTTLDTSFRTIQSKNLGNEFNFAKVVDAIIEHYKDKNEKKNNVLEVFAEMLYFNLDNDKEVKMLEKIYDYHKKLESQAGGAENIKRPEEEKEKKQPEKRLNMKAIKKAFKELQKLQEKYKNGDINEIKSIVKEASDKVKKLKKDAEEVEVQRKFKSRLISKKNKIIKEVREKEAEQQRKQEEEKKRKKEEAAKKKEEEDKKKKKEVERIKSIRDDYDENIEKIKSNLKKLKEFSILCEQLTSKKITLENLANCQEIEKEIERDINDYDNNNFDYLEIKTFSELNEKLESKIKYLQKIKKEDDAKKKKIAEEELKRKEKEEKEEEEKRKIKEAEDEKNKAEKIYEEIFIELGSKFILIINEKERKKLGEEYETINKTHTKSKSAANKETKKLDKEIKIKKAYKKGIEEYKKLKVKIEKSIEKEKKLIRKEEEEKERKRKEEEDKRKEENKKRITEKIQEEIKIGKAKGKYKEINQSVGQLIQSVRDNDIQKKFYTEYNIIADLVNKLEPTHKNQVELYNNATTQLNKLKNKIETMILKEKEDAKKLERERQALEKLAKEKSEKEERERQAQEKLAKEESKKATKEWIKVGTELSRIMEKFKEKISYEMNNDIIEEIKNIDIYYKKNKGVENIKKAIFNKKNLIEKIKLLAEQAEREEQQRLAQQKAKREREQQQLQLEQERKQKQFEEQKEEQKLVQERDKLYAEVSKSYNEEELFKFIQKFKLKEQINELSKLKQDIQQKLEEKNRLYEEVLRLEFFDKQQLSDHINKQETVEKQIVELKNLKQQALDTLKQQEEQRAEQAAQQQEQLNKANEDLPRGWGAAFDKDSGKIFYYNETTKQSQWKKPEQQRTSSPRQQQQQGNVCNRYTMNGAIQKMEHFVRTTRFPNNSNNFSKGFFEKYLLHPTMTQLYTKYQNKPCNGKARTRLKNKISVAFYFKFAVPYEDFITIDLYKNILYNMKNFLESISNEEPRFVKIDENFTKDNARQSLINKGYFTINQYNRKLELNIGDRYVKLIEDHMNSFPAYLFRAEGEVTETNILNNQSSSELLTDSSEISSSVKIKKQKGGGKRKKIKGSDKINKLKYKLYKKLVDKNLI